MLSIITPSVRPEGIQLVNKAIKRQTIDRNKFEWIVVVPKAYFKDIKIPNEVDSVVYEPEKKKDDKWALNKAYNKAIKQSNGDLIISWQDYTFADPTILEKFYYHFLDEPKTLVTGVGNKYSDDTWTVQTWKDPRERSDQGSYYQCYFNDIEFNLCSIPRQAIYDVGGFDEDLDKWFGMDGYSVVDRINMIGGYDFKLDQTIKSYSLEHGRFDRWEEDNALHGPYSERRKVYLANPHLPYL